MIRLRLVIAFLVFNAAKLYAYDFELHKTAKPTEYDITIIPNLTEGTYIGRVLIDVKVLKNTNSVTLHSKKLEIIDAKIDNTETTISTNIPYDFLILNTNKKLLKGVHRIAIEFKGDMKNKTYGFYRGYEEENGKKIYFGATFFEPINARAAFPCFDEPTFKAKFSIHLAKPPGYTALSNMNQIHATPGPNNYTFVHFAQTPPMSNYLVSIFVGNYTYVEDFYVTKSNKTVPTRVYSPPGKIKNSHFAVKQMPKQLEWFVNYTGFEFMMPKLGELTIISINSSSLLS